MGNSDHEIAHKIERLTYRYLCDLYDLKPKAPDCMLTFINMILWSVSCLVGTTLDEDFNTGLREVKGRNCDIYFGICPYCLIPLQDGYCRWCHYREKQ